VQRVIRGIRIENDLRRRTRVRFQKHIDEQRLDRRRVMAHLVIPRWLRPAQFQPVQRRLAGQRCAVAAPRLQRASHHCQHRIVPQLVVVVQVFIAKRDADHTLHHQRVDAVFH
jgi:hypothetical protein